MCDVSSIGVRYLQACDVSRHYYNVIRQLRYSCSLLATQAMHIVSRFSLGSRLVYVVVFSTRPFVSCPT
jgi:hypothetical protein